MLEYLESMIGSLNDPICATSTMMGSHDHCKPILSSSWLLIYSIASFLETQLLSHGICRTTAPDPSTMISELLLFEKRWFLVRKSQNTRLVSLNPSDMIRDLILEGILHPELTIPTAMTGTPEYTSKIVCDWSPVMDLSKRLFMVGISNTST